MTLRTWSLRSVAAAALLGSSFLSNGTALAWQPGDTLELIVPAGQGGGADQMMRKIGFIIETKRLSKQKIIVANKPGGSGAEGYLYLKNKPGSDTLLVTLSSIFTLPVAMGTNFRWNELTPLSRMALDDFILWVHTDTPYKKLEDYLGALKASPGTFKMGGTGAAQEDQIVTTMLEQAAHVKFTYVPLGGGGDVAKILISKKIDSTVNNPSEIVAFWRGGKARPLGLFASKRMTLPEWKDIPTMKEQGYDIQYQMMRGIFGPPDMPVEAVKYYVDLLHKVYQTDEFQKYLADNALTPAWLTGKTLAQWSGEQDALHKKLLSMVGLK